jgi:bacterioferritin (cytochrome b1)
MLNSFDLNDQSQVNALLNEFRSAEIRGAGVILRLGRLADSSDLRENFTKHLRDEAVHAWMWTRAIVALGGEVTDSQDAYQTRLGTHFGVPKTLNELLALTVTSERRGVMSYEEVLGTPSAPPVMVRTAKAILKDERWHVSWIETELNRRTESDPNIEEVLSRAAAADLLAVADTRRAIG